MHEFLLIRHGQAAAGPSHMDRDHFLTDLGRQQVRSSASALEALGVRPIRIYVSPLTRARQTAEILQSRLGGELRQRDDLYEHGARILLEKAPIEEVSRRHPDLISPDGQIRVSGPGADGSGLTPDFCIGGETTAALHHRAARAWSEIATADLDLDGPTFIVAHGSLLSAMAGEALGLPRRSVWQVEFECATFLRLRVYRNATTQCLETAVCA